MVFILRQPQSEFSLYFSLSVQRLDPSQLESLLNNPGSAVPMWLNIACEELRVFGDFATLSRKIRGLPPSLEGLLKEVLMRLIKEDDSHCMEKVREFRQVG